MSDYVYEIIPNAPVKQQQPELVTSNRFPISFSIGDSVAVDGLHYTFRQAMSFRTEQDLILYVKRQLRVVEHRPSRPSWLR